MTQLKINNCIISVIQGDITEQTTEAIVNAANNRLVMGGGVAGAIRRKGGVSIEEEAVKLGPIPIGESVVTAAGKLKAKFVIHAATMGMDFATDGSKIKEATRSALKRAEEKKVKSISFPALGCGVGGFPVEDSARIMLDESIEHIKKNSSLKEVVFVLFNKKSFLIFQNYLDLRERNLS